MLRKITKYHHFFFSLLLIAYSASAFQHIIYEVLHELSHSMSAAMINVDNHSHQLQHAQGIDHEHPFLEIIDPSNNQDQQDPNQVKEMEKKVELNTPPVELLTESSEQANNYIITVLHSIFYKDCLSPPPEFT